MFFHVSTVQPVSLSILLHSVFFVFFLYIFLGPFVFTCVSFFVFLSLYSSEHFSFLFLSEILYFSTVWNIEGFFSFFFILHENVYLHKTLYNSNGERSLIRWRKTLHESIQVKIYMKKSRRIVKNELNEYTASHKKVSEILCYTSCELKFHFLSDVEIFFIFLSKRSTKFKVSDTKIKYKFYSILSCTTVQSSCIIFYTFML
jgi:hypothetical protein